LLSEHGYSVFCIRLNALFATRQPGLTNARVCDALRQQGYRISTPYLSQLRTGVRRAPSATVMHGLAQFFGVTTSHFFDSRGDSGTEDSRHSDALLIAQLSDEPVKHLLGLTNALSSDSQEMLISLVDRLRESDRLASRKSRSQ